VSVDCVRIGSVRLCLALMLGLLVVSGYVVVPVLFAKAGSHALAGMLAGAIFHLANLALIFLAVAVMVFWLRMSKSGMVIGKLRWSLLLIVAVLVAGNEYGITPVIIDLKVRMGPIDLVAADDPLRKLFGIWHGISALIHMFAAIAMVLLVALGEARSGKSNQNYS